MTAPRVVLISLWRNDVDKRLGERMDHLTSKTYPAVRYVWIVGDSSDDTEQQLRTRAAQDPRITVVRFDTGIESSDPTTRLRQLSETGAAGLDQVNVGDRWVVLHESDLVSPPDLIERFLAAGKDVIAGWVTLHRSDSEEPIFYDTWGMTKDGQMFSNFPPYHPAYVPDRPFQVDSVGSCFMFPAAAALDGLRARQWGVRELCWGLRERGYTVWLDPTLPIVQPRDLWTSHSHAPAPV